MPSPARCIVSLTCTSSPSHLPHVLPNALPLNTASLHVCCLLRLRRHPSCVFQSDSSFTACAQPAFPAGIHKPPLLCPSFNLSRSCSPSPPCLQFAPLPCAASPTLTDVPCLTKRPAGATTHIVSKLAVFKLLPAAMREVAMFGNRGCTTRVVVAQEARITHGVLPPVAGHRLVFLPAFPACLPAFLPACLPACLPAGPAWRYMFPRRTCASSCSAVIWPGRRRMPGLKRE